MNYIPKRFERNIIAKTPLTTIITGILKWVGHVTFTYLHVK